MSFKERKAHDKGFKIQLSKEKYENLQQYFVSNVRNSEAFGIASTSLINATNTGENIQCDAEIEVTSPVSNPVEESNDKPGSGQESTLFINAARTKRRRSSSNLDETLKAINEDRYKKSNDEISNMMDRFESATDKSTSVTMTLLGGIIEGAIKTLVTGMNPIQNDSNGISPAD